MNYANPPPTTDPVASLPRIFRIGYVLDRLLCALLFAGDGVESMSHLLARKQAMGVWWGCWFCAALSVLVEALHCQKTLAAGDTSKSAMWRAGTFMVLGLIVTALAINGLFHLILSAIRHLL